MKALILADGDRPSAAFAQRLAQEHDLLLATDGAAHKAAQIGLLPDIISGDFDSVRREEAQALFPGSEWIQTYDQDAADLEKAVWLVRERGAQAVTILGGTGGRWDHTQTAFALLVRYHAEFDICLRDAQTTCRALGTTNDTWDTTTFATLPGDTISLVAQGSVARVTIAGVHWPLDNAVLPPGTLGVSNVAAGEAVTVSVQHGTVLLFHLHSS